MQDLLKVKKARFILITLAILILLPFVIKAHDFVKSFEDKPEKIGFIILGDVKVPGWNESHYKGIKSACENFGLELLVRENVKENCGQCEAAIRSLAQEGASMIFLGSYVYPVECQKIIEDYPDITFITISAEIHKRNLTTYFPRIYQARYLAGVLAGMKTKSNVIGYVAAMSNTEVNRGINAFTLGVQKVNPNAKVAVMWTGAWQDEKTEEKNSERLIKEVGADVLTYHQDEETPAKVAEKFGVDFIAYNSILNGYSDHYLTSVICNWDLYYTEVIRRYLKGEVNAKNNYWIGINRGSVALSDYSPAVTGNMIQKIDYVRQELANDNLIFIGPLYDNHGNLICEEGDAISDNVLLKDMNWLVKGVEVLE